MHILIVEDDRWLAECYQQWLQRVGFETSWCTDAQSALDAADEHAPDAVLLDLLLPGANGIQLLQELRTHADLLRIPVIVCSSALPEPLPNFSVYNVVQILDKSALTPRKLQVAVKKACHAGI